MSDTNINEAINNFEGVQARYKARQAIERLQGQFEEILGGDDLEAARALIEKVHLICGDRRVKHVSVSVERRQS